MRPRRPRDRRLEAALLANMVPLLAPHLGGLAHLIGDGYVGLAPTVEAVEAELADAALTIIRRKERLAERSGP